MKLKVFTNKKTGQMSVVLPKKKFKKKIREIEIKTNKKWLK